MEAQPTPAPKRGSVVHCNGSAHLTLERAHLEDALQSGTFLWLDLLQPEAADFDVLRDVFGFHPLALEDSWKFGQRPKLEEYDTHVFLVVYGASPDEDRLVEVHCFYSERYLVTIHRDEAPSLVALRERYARRGPPIDEPVRLLHTVVDGLVDSFFPTLAELDDRIDELEDAIFLRADDAQLREIFAMKRLLVGVRKVVSPQRDLFASVAVGAVRSAGHDCRRRTLLPRRLRPSDPHQRPGRHVPRPPHRRDGRVPLDRLEPAQRRDEATRDHRDGVHAADLPDRLLRPELPVAGGRTSAAGRPSWSSGSRSSWQRSRWCSATSGAAGGSPASRGARRGATQGRAHVCRQPPL